MKKLIPLLFEMPNERYLVVAVLYLGWQEYDCRWWGNDISQYHDKVLKADVDIEHHHVICDTMEEVHQAFIDILKIEVE